MQAEEVRFRIRGTVGRYICMRWTFACDAMQTERSECCRRREFTPSRRRHSTVLLDWESDRVPSGVAHSRRVCDRALRRLWLSGCESGQCGLEWLCAVKQVRCQWGKKVCCQPMRSYA